MRAKNISRILFPIVLLIFLNPISYSQEIRNNENPAKELDYNDFKVISSNNSYIEIEFFPEYTNATEFLNQNINVDNFGKPNIGIRTFPIFTPSDKGNRIDIIDFKFEELSNIDINPIPTPINRPNKLEVTYETIKDNEIYGKNADYPSNISDFINAGIIRNKYIGYANISPILYNPVSRILKKAVYIRFRVTFGSQPIISNKLLSKDEIYFFTGISVNSDVSMNWSTKEFNRLKTGLAQNSVLVSGDFYKIEVKEDGIYKIDKSYLEQAGINVNNIDPRTIKIYNNGGRELPFDNSLPAPDDLIENRIFIQGEADGKFDNNDYILFYGQSPHNWTYNSFLQKYAHSLNSYTNSNFYWITYGGINGKRMQFIASQNQPNLTPLPSFEDKFFEEPEVNNLGSTGDLWISQRIGVNESFIWNKDLKGYIDGSNIKFKLRLGNGSFSSNASFLVKDENSNFSILKTIYYVTGLFSHISLDILEAEYSLLTGKNSIKLSASLPSQYNGANISGYYDYLEIIYNRSLNSAVNNYLKITAPDTLGIIEYRVSTFNSNDTKIFDVTQFDDVNIITPISFSNGTLRFQDLNTPGTRKEYAIAGNGGYKSPASISSKISNQNIHGITEGASFIIISPTEFLPAAKRLKGLRESFGPGHPNYLKTVVFELNQVYNEFSGGLQDPLATRNLLKHAFNNWNTRPVYVLFMGDGSYDFKNIYGLNVKNYLPPMQKTTDDMNEIASYVSDDFICDINESFPSPNGLIRVDFSIGRININTLNDAHTVIDKIERYESQSSNGIWKKKIMYVADDGWTTEFNQGQEGNIHTQQCEEIAESYTPKDFEKEKIYIVTYPAVITPQGRRKPGANSDIVKGWNEGRLVINYTGHGSSDLWAHEHIFVRDETIPQLKNEGRYPIVTIASCDLLRWDDPFLLSAGEQLVNVKSGAIGVIAAVRPVFSNYNATFNNSLWSNFMFVKDTLNLPIRIGKAMYNVKNQLPSLTDNDLKFCLSGDPTLRVSIPQYFTKIDSINGTSGNDTAVIKALQRVKISGSVLKSDSSFWSDYNGSITLKVMDVDKNIIFFDFNQPFYFRLDGGTIFKGTTSIKNGKWSLEFIVPKDISYNTGTGRILAYFSNNQTEGSGFSNHFVLNGIDTTAAVDTTGPEISLFIDSRNFRSGDLINQNTKIIADIFDISGINLTGTIGHKIEAIINNNDNDKIDLTGFYNSTSGYQYGNIEYPLDNLAEGNYRLKLRVWDTYNNPSESEVEFIVKANTSLTVSNVYNYPNPMKDNTSFTFQHNFNDPLQAEIKIYTVSGRLIKTIKKTNISDKYVVIEWDGKDNDGDHIANGTYIYKLIVKSEGSNFNNIITGKLAKLK